MNEDLDFDLEDLESRLYSQVYHTSAEENVNQPPNVITFDVGKNMRKQNVRYFQSGISERPQTMTNNSTPLNNFQSYTKIQAADYFSIHPLNMNATPAPPVVNTNPQTYENHPNTKARAADFFNVQPNNIRGTPDVPVNNTVPQIVNMINPHNNILLLNQVPTNITHNSYIPLHGRSNRDKYLERETRREAVRQKKIANRRRRKEKKYCKDFYQDFKNKLRHFNVHHLAGNLSSTKSRPPKVVTIDSDTDDDSCVEIPEKRELIVLSSDESDMDEKPKLEQKIIKKELKDNCIADDIKTTEIVENPQPDDDDVLLIDDIPKDLEVIEIDCDVSTITNAESNKNSSEKSIETSSTCSELKKINTTPNKSLTLGKQSAIFNPKERHDLLKTPDSTSNDFLENIDCQQKKFNFGLHGSDFNEDNQHFLKPRTVASETESSCSASDHSTPIKNTVFNEVEFEMPNKELFSENNLESFGNYITPTRKDSRANNSTETNFDKIVTKASKRLIPKTVSDHNSDSSSESDYSEKGSSSKMKKTLPDLTSMNEVIATDQNQEINKSAELSNKRKSDVENSISNKKMKDGEEIKETDTVNEDNSVIYVPNKTIPAIVIDEDETANEELLEKDAPNKSTIVEDISEQFFLIDSDSLSLDSDKVIATDLQLINCKTPPGLPKKIRERKEHGFSKYWTTDMNKFYNDSWGLENFSVKDIQQTMSDDRKLWKVIGDDLSHYRYSNSSGTRCNKCREVGHFAKNCLNAKRPIVCALCGQVGHVDARCRNGMCTSCGSTGGYTTYCSGCTKWNKRQCRICSMYGHIDINCPDLWRRYHLTTEPGPIVKPARPNLKHPQDRWCSGCSKNRHYEYKCRFHHRSHHAVDPHVFEYTDVYNFPKSQPFLIHCDLTSSTNPSPSTSSASTSKTNLKSDSIRVEPSCSTSIGKERPNTINTVNFKGRDYKGRVDNIFPPVEMIPLYFQEQFMYIEDVSDERNIDEDNYYDEVMHNPTENDTDTGICDKSDYDIVHKLMNIDGTNQIEYVPSTSTYRSVRCLDENLYGYIQSSKGRKCLERITKQTNISYIIDKRFNDEEDTTTGRINIYGTYRANVQNALEELDNFLNLMPLLDNIPKFSKSAVNFLRKKFDSVENTVIKPKETYRSLIMLQNTLNTGDNVIATKRRIFLTKVQLNMFLFGKLLLGDGKKHMDYLYNLYNLYESTDNYKIPLEEVFDFVESYSFIFTDSVNHNYEEYVHVQPPRASVTQKNINNSNKLMKLYKRKCMKFNRLDEMEQLKYLKSCLDSALTLKAYMEFTTFCYKLSNDFRNM